MLVSNLRSSELASAAAELKRWTSALERSDVLLSGLFESLEIHD
jgi:hypothetical protein